jgi:hypoxanthine phosphoribosyltransferase
MRDYREFLSEILIDEQTLQNRIKELGEEISRDYAGEDLLLICILRGGLVFMVDLMRHITVPHGIDCMAISSYGAGAWCWSKISWIAGTPFPMCSKC